MLTRLKVSGFKNLVDVDVRFGPFTCIAGANAAGKSNLFDAIHFLSLLAEKPLIEAALSVRDEGGRTADVRSLFHRVGSATAERMSFEAEMIISKAGLDDLGQEAKASATFLKYSVSIGYREEAGWRSLGGLELLKEELVYITKGEAPRHLLFPHRPAQWRETAVHNNRFGGPYISTRGEGAERRILLHQDGGRRGQPLPHLATSLPRTVLSVTNAAESPTALLARNEMRSSRLLQLEPSSLRKPDEFTAPSSLGPDGSHLAATLYRLARDRAGDAQDGEPEEDAAERVYSDVANRLSSLIDDVYAVEIDRDERRELLTLQVRGIDGTLHPARSLSDGTLRFLALAVIDLDPRAQGVLCLEEPENGIHPDRIPAMLQLLQAIATDVDQPLGSDNPLRQVIINTHSPAVVAQVPDGSLLVAELKESVVDGQRFKRVCFSPLPATWRQSADGPAEPVSRGKLLAYLSPVPFDAPEAQTGGNGAKSRSAKRPRRVIDRQDLQALLPFAPEPE